MLKKLLPIALLLTCHTFATHAAKPDENVVITSGIEEYRFVQGKNGPEIKHSTTLEYQATRRSERIRPHIFHSNIISLDKASGGKAQYRNANSPTVFHDDSKVCYFDILLDRKDRKAKVQFRRTFTDGAHFTGVFPSEEYPVRSKQIVFHIPASLPAIELVDRHFPASGITRDDRTAPDGSRTITYNVSSLPEIPDDTHQPSALSALPHIMVRGYFPDCDSLYRYHRPMLDVDTVIAGASATVAGLTDGAKDRLEAIGRIYRHVQQNIRYVAFEAGEAAYRPDTPAEVMRKRYGDCKGMSMLLATLLNRAGIEARIAAVGTDVIPFRIAEAPSLAATNHMICIVPDGDSWLFLDPTHEQISARHIPEWIRGKDAMMFTSEGYRMIEIPSTSPVASADILNYNYRLTPDGLSGIAYRHYSEDMAEHFIKSYAEVPGQHLNELLAKALVPTQRAAVPADSITYKKDTPGEITFWAPILNTAALTEADNTIYIDMNTSGDPLTSRIDTDERRSDYQFPMTGLIKRRTTVMIPENADVTLPDNYRHEGPIADFSCIFSREGQKINMTKTLLLHTARLPLQEIPGWNKAVSTWNEACNQQIEIRLRN